MRPRLLIHPVVKFLLCLLDIAVAAILLYGGTLLLSGVDHFSILHRLAGLASLVSGCGLSIANYASAVKSISKLKLRAGSYALVSAVAILAVLDASLPKEEAASTTAEISSSAVFAIICVVNALISVRLLRIDGDGLNSMEEDAARRAD